MVPLGMGRNIYVVLCNPFPLIRNDRIQVGSDMCTASNPNIWQVSFLSEGYRTPGRAFLEPKAKVPPTPPLSPLRKNAEKFSIKWNPLKKKTFSPLKGRRQVFKGCACPGALPPASAINFFIWHQIRLGEGGGG